MGRPWHRMDYSALLRMGYSLNEGQWVQLPNGQGWEEHPPSPRMAVSPLRDADGEALRLELAELFAPLVRRVGAAALARAHARVRARAHAPRAPSRNQCKYPNPRSPTTTYTLQTAHYITTTQHNINNNTT